MLQTLAQNKAIPASDPGEVAKYSEEDVIDAIEDVRGDAGMAAAPELLDQELDQLQYAATHGAPAVPSKTPDRPPLFEVIHKEVRSLSGANGTTVRITPVSRLQVTMVQRGYRRILGEEPDKCQLVTVAYHDGQRDWYPGVDLNGEGVFLDLQPPDGHVACEHFPLQGQEASSWDRTWHDPVAHGYEMDVRDRLHPVAVWWHTLAHRLITALAVDSGYSSASVRERVYIRVNPITGLGGGGILLYTAQPGGDGTLGGLISLVPGFHRVWQRALRDLDSCSNDPLCGEQQFVPGRYNGAACYACLLVSETSCEHRNFFLDRNLLLNNRP